MVRPINSDDLEQKVNIMGGSAGLTAPTMEVYQRLMSSPTYKQELDLVIVDEEDQIVGFANVSVQELSPIEVAILAAFLCYRYKFVSLAQDTNLYRLPIR